MSTMVGRWLGWLVRPFYRKPDFLIGGTPGDPYMRRWFVIPRNRRFGNIYLHHFLHDDDDRACHCHPWPSLSFMLRGHLREHYLDEAGNEHVRELKAPSIVYRNATFRHRLVVLRPAWTIFCTGRVIREWGFWCENKRFVPWRDFVDVRDAGAIGKGCGE